MTALSLICSNFELTSDSDIRSMLGRGSFIAPLDEMHSVKNRPTYQNPCYYQIPAISLSIQTPESQNVNLYKITLLLARIGTEQMPSLHRCRIYS